MGVLPYNTGDSVVRIGRHRQVIVGMGAINRSGEAINVNLTDDISAAAAVCNFEVDGTRNKITIVHNRVRIVIAEGSVAVEVNRGIRIKAIAWFWSQLYPHIIRTFFKDIF